MITLQGVNVRRGRFQLQDVSFTLAAGQYGVVIGPAGAGKTTLLEVIAGLASVTAGRVALGGQDAHDVPPEERGVGVVYQHGYLFPHLSVRENVAYGASDAAVMQEVCERLGVTPLLARAVDGLSGGERQLVALARALARKPRVLLLDEPFSALDPRRRSHVRREVRRLHGEWGLTTLQVTHDIGEARRVGDYVILLEDGRIVEAGAPVALFEHPSADVAAFLGEDVD